MREGAVTSGNAPTASDSVGSRRLDSKQMRQPLPASASGYFGSMVESYDSLIRRAVPRYDEMITRLVEYLPSEANDILELGSGTGNLSLLLAQKFPKAALTIVDASAEMLAVARSRLGRSGLTRVNGPVSMASRVEDLDFLPGSFDLIVSSITLHHVVNKGALYRRIRAALRDRGTFCFADQI